MEESDDEKAELVNREKAKLINRLRAEEARLEGRLDAVRLKLAELRHRSHTHSRPLRTILLDLLDEARSPLNSLLLASVIRPLFGRGVPSTRFGTLSDDEVHSFESSRARPVYLCHCLTDRGQAVKRFWARSNWPLPDRIMGPMTGRILFLKGAAWTICLARSVDEHRLVASNPDMLKYVAADQARDAGLPVKRGDFPYEEWLAAIEGDIKRHDTQDRTHREAWAGELANRLSEKELLFGKRGDFVSLPGSSKTWRSAYDDG